MQSDRSVSVCGFSVIPPCSKEPSQQRVKRWGFSLDEALKDPVGAGPVPQVPGVGVQLGEPTVRPRPRAASLRPPTKPLVSPVVAMGPSNAVLR